jgi:DNA ligase 1
VEALAAALAEVEATAARGDKTRTLGDAFAQIGSREPGALAFAVRFVCGAPLAVGSGRPLGVGWRLARDAIEAATGLAPEAVATETGAAGDLGTAVSRLLDARGGAGGPPLSVTEARDAFDAIARAGARGTKAREVTTLLRRGSSLVTRYLVRALLGEMRVGARAGVVEDAVALAFGRDAASVRRAAAITGDIGDAAALALWGALETATPRVGAPMSFMLATPIEIARGAPLSSEAWVVEEKIDGVRAQLHVAEGGAARLFARGKGDVTRAFPELVGAASSIEAPAILDGEIVVVTADGRPRPFSALQRRLGRVSPGAALQAELPVRYLAYDLMVSRGGSHIDVPFRERRARLEALARAFVHPMHIHSSRALSGEADVDAAFDLARAGGFEGLVLKRADAPYEAGSRGRAWLKVKRALTTLDVVVVAAQRGHGKRAGVLSDYTFAVRSDGDALVVVGKAYSGLTDKEIAALTERFRAIATAPETRGTLPVRAEIVLEVAFDGVQRSDRHDSGYALRFPRIARVRDDKGADEIDTLDAVARIFDAQVAAGEREREPAPARAARSDPTEDARQLSLFGEAPAARRRR